MMCFLMQCDGMKVLIYDYFHIILLLLYKRDFGLVSHISFPTLYSEQNLPS